MNVNVCLDILVTQEIEMAAAWSQEINVQPALNVPKMKNVKRMNEPEAWNVDQFVKMFIVGHKQFVCPTITLPNVNARQDHTQAIHTI